MLLNPTLVIPRRFCGPPDSGNGGYVCGRLAAFIEGPAKVRLKVPPPLETPMEVRRAPVGYELMLDDQLIATVRATQLALHVPAPPLYAVAEAAARNYAGFRSHVFPTCFVCGPRRGAGDGLRIFPGHVAASNVVAAPWIPDGSLDAGDGSVLPHYVWAALDCPGAFSFQVPAGTPLLLGEMAAELKGTIRVGERCVVIGWELTSDGRRHYTGTAIFSEGGECRGVARATWFEVTTRTPAGQSVARV